MVAINFWAVSAVPRQCQQTVLQWNTTNGGLKGGFGALQSILLPPHLLPPKLVLRSSQLHCNHCGGLRGLSHLTESVTAGQTCTHQATPFALDFLELAVIREKGRNGVQRSPRGDCVLCLEGSLRISLWLSASRFPAVVTLEMKFDLACAFELELTCSIFEAVDCGFQELLQFSCTLKMECGRIPSDSLCLSWLVILNSEQ